MSVAVINNNPALTKTGRVYRLGTRRIPSVTDILSMVIDDLSYLDQDMLMRAAERGTEVHTLTEQYDMETLDWETLPENRKGYVDAYIAFCADHDWQPCDIEKLVCNEKYFYAGTVDRTGWIHKLSEEKVVLDIKTGTLQPTVALQLAGYEAALGEPLRRYALRLTADGEYELKEYTDKSDRGVFLSAAAVCHWMLKNGKAKFKESN